MRDRALFKNPWPYLATLFVGVALLYLANGLLRHRGDQDFKLTEWRTYATDPWFNPYWSLIKWKPRVEYAGDFRPIFESAQGYAQDRSFPMYQPDQLKQGRSAFVYTPIVALVLSPLCKPGTKFKHAAQRLSMINHVMWLASGIMLAMMLVYRRRPRAWAIGLFALHYLLYYPLAKSLQLTQASIWIYTFLVTAGFLLQRGWISLAGVALAAAVSIKPHLVTVPVLLFFVPGFPRRLLYFCFGGVAVAATISLIYAGWDNCMDYGLRTLPILSSGYAYFPNQSINGLLLRLFTDNDPSNFNLVEPVGWIKAASSAFGLAVLAVALLAARWGGAAPKSVEPMLAYALMVTAGTVASPVCWYHHLSALTVTFTITVWYLWGQPALRKWWLEGTLLLAFLLTGTFLDTEYLQGVPDALLSAPGFYGTLLLLVCLIYLTLKTGKAGRTG